MKAAWCLLLVLGGVALLAESNDESASFAPLAVDLAQLPQSSALAPAVDIPPELRTANWGGGSCVHASTVHLLHWQGQPALAQWWRATYSGGEHASRLHERLDAAHLRYAYTTAGDVAFLEWALRMRRGAGITYFPNHAVNLVHLDGERAGVLDNNRLEQVIWIPREEFLTRWRNYGGWGWTLVYTPPPPLPFIDKE